MTRGARLLAMLIFAAGGSAASADEAVVRLPDDGAWVRYFMTIRQNGRPEQTAILKVSLVGTEMNKSRRCRWFEMQFDMHKPGGNETDYVSTMKYLVPEVDLIESDAPLKGLLRGWIRGSDGVVSDQVQGDEDFILAAQLLQFPGTRNKSQPLQERVSIQHQRGEFTVTEGATGRCTTQGRRMLRHVDYKVWLHPDLSLGYAQATLRNEFIDNGAVRAIVQIEYRLQDFGSDAKTALEAYK